MTYFRATLEMHAFNNNAEDRYTMTVHHILTNGVSHATAHTQMAAAWQAFLDETGHLIAAYVQRTAFVHTYNISQPPVRVPISSTVTLPTAVTTNPSIPPESAVVIGYRGDLPHTPSRRNRIYFGPFGNTIIQSGSTASFPTVSGSARDTLILGAQAMLDASIDPMSALKTWEVYSTKNGNSVPIAEWIVDEEVDTQRRRGFTTTVRTITPVT